MWAIPVTARRSRIKKTCLPIQPWPQGITLTLHVRSTRLSSSSLGKSPARSALYVHRRGDALWPKQQQQQQQQSSSRFKISDEKN